MEVASHAEHMVYYIDVASHVKRMILECLASHAKIDVDSHENARYIVVVSRVKRVDASQCGPM